MNEHGVIKARDSVQAETVRPFLNKSPQVSQVPSQPESKANSSQHLASVDLIEKIAQRDAEISTHQQALKEAYAKGKADGRTAAEDEFQDSRKEALATLELGVEDAKRELTEALNSLESLALLVAVEAVEKLVGDADSFRAMLTLTISNQVKQIGAASLLAVTVARIDFPDTREVAALEEKLSLQPGLLLVQNELEPGECRIKLMVGALEIGLTRNWTDMKAMLESMATGGVGE
jgi:flagellar assembly protein FliH